MSSSVASECAFSQGGITITRLRNRLNGDIVEALQCLKSGIKNNTSLRDPESALELDEDWDDLGDDEPADTDHDSLDGIHINDDDSPALYEDSD
jgi:hypothetical protein